MRKSNSGIAFVLNGSGECRPLFDFTKAEAEAEVKLNNEQIEDTELVSFLEFDSESYAVNILRNLYEHENGTFNDPRPLKDLFIKIFEAGVTQGMRMK